MATATARRTKTAAPLTLTLLALAKGEHYAGILLDDKGALAHHLVLLAGDTKLSWADAGAWAKKQGGELPTRREHSLLFANLKGKFERDWYWSSEQYAGGADWAWSQHFGHGNQYCYGKSVKLRARAVRRVPIR
jgi:hypothetical protein